MTYPLRGTQSFGLHGEHGRRIVRRSPIVMLMMSSLYGTAQDVSLSGVFGFPRFFSKPVVLMRQQSNMSSWHIELLNRFALDPIASQS